MFDGRMGELSRRKEQLAASYINTVEELIAGLTNIYEGLTRSGPGAEEILVDGAPHGAQA